MSLFLVLTFLFFVGSVAGWVLELFYRRFFSRNNPERKWINPGFLTGPYLPLYGFSLVILFSLSHINVTFIKQPVLQKIVLFAVMALFITLFEYIAGLIFIKKMNIALWDYSKCWGNIQGIICPQYTFYWWLLSGIYYFLIHPRILNWLYWFTNHISFSFVVGFFYGIICIDFCYSLQIMTKIRKFAKENQVVIRLENLKNHIHSERIQRKEKSRFLFILRNDKEMVEETLKQYIKKIKDFNHFN